MRRAILAVLLAGCGTETVTFPPDLWEFESTTTWNDTPMRPNSFRFGCDPQMTSWVLDFETRWWLEGDGQMTLYTDDSAFTEVHPVNRYEIDNDLLFSTGPLADAATTAIPGQSTILDCETDQGLVGVVVELYDDRDTLVDCAWTGPAFDSVALALADPAYSEFGGCLRFEM